MILFIKGIFNKFEATFTIKDSIWSSKKLTAFVIMLLVVISHACWLKHSYYKADYSLLPEILVIDYGIICICLGMTTYEKIKNSTNDNKKEKSIKDDSLNTN